MNYVKHIKYNFLLVFKTYTESNEKIIDKFKEIFNLKLDLINQEKNSNRTYKINELQDLETVFSELSMYIPSLFDYLWKSPESISTLLLHAEKRDIKNILGNFFMNNFYYNISSLNSKDDQLIYIITLLLKEEINSLKDENEFSNNSRCSIIFESFFDKKEIRLYLKKILFDVVKRMDTASFTDYIYLFEQNDKIDNKMPTLEIVKNNKFNMKTFTENYIYKSVNKEELEKKILEYDNDEISIVLKKLIKDIEDHPNKYLNQTFINNMRSSKCKNILDHYYVFFCKVIEIIDLLFENLLKYIESIPYSIRCLCKIISVLAEKKYQKSKYINKYSFLYNIFFHNLILPALVNPLSTLIDEYKISTNAIHNINTIIIIIKNLCFGDLFGENNYTPFNWYIIEKIPTLFEFYNNICDVDLPDFIEKLIYDQLPKDYKYDYFKENPEERFIYRNICFNVEELYCLVCNIEKCKDIITLNEKLTSKFIAKKTKLEQIKKKESEKNCEASGKKIVNYFLLTNFIVNEKFEKMTNIKNRQYFILKELKSNKSDEEIVQSKLIKLKNVFFALLYNSPTLSKNYFRKRKKSDIKSILKEILTLPIINIDNTYIPNNFYVNFVLDHLYDLPNDLKENDYEELLNEMESEVTKSIQGMNSNEITSFGQYLKETEKEKNIYETIKTIAKNMEFDKKIRKIAEKTIKLDLTINDNKLVNFFSQLAQNNQFSKLFDLDINKKKKTKIISTTINSFIQKFPKIEMLEIIGEADLFQDLEKKQIPNIINNFFLMVKQNLEEEKIIDEEIRQDIYNKIYDYITEQINDKLFPKEPSVKDIKIFQNSYKHSWIRLSNLIRENNYILEDYLFDSFIWFIKFEKEKSPRKKLLCIKEIFEYIYKFSKINGVKEVGLDEEMTLLLYILIKSRLQRIYSNCKYTELFRDENKDGLEKNE